MIDEIKRTGEILTKPERKKLALLGIGSVVLSLSEAFSIGIIIPIITLFIEPGKIKSSASLRWLYDLSGARDERFFLLILIAVAFILYLFKTIYSMAMVYLQQSTMGQLYNRLTTKVLQSYLEKPYAFHLMNNSSILFKNASTETSGFVYYFLNPVISICSEGIILSGICLLLLIIYPVYMCFTIGCLGIVVLFVNMILKKRIKLYAEQRKIFSGLMYKRALEALGAAKEIHVYNASKFFVAKYYDSTRRYTDGNMKFSVISSLPRYIFEMFLIVSLLTLIVFNSFFNKTALELVPMLTVFGVAALRLLPSLSKIYTGINHFHFSQNSLDIVFDILHDNAGEPDIPQAAGAQRSPCEDRAVLKLENITFRYDTAPAPVLENFTLEIPLRGVIAVVGKTGAGKTTLIDILMGLLSPTKGVLTYCGTVINGGNIRQYRRKIGYVPQNVFLIDEKISSNIAFGLPDNEIDSNKLNEAVEMAQLGSFVKELPKGLDTEIGERGVRISGGQRQRIGIARVLYRNPEILILDEATSALDEHTEEAFYKALEGLERKPAIILITHRLNTLKHADTIYVMDNGKIVEKGNLAKLLKESAYFQRITSEEKRDS